MEHWIEVKICPVCGMDAAKPYQRTMGVPYWSTATPFAPVPSATVTEYVQCQMCGMVWQSPRMDDETLYKFYAEGHYRAITGGQDSDERERAARIVADVEKRQLKPHFHLDIGCSRGYLLTATKKVFNCAVHGVDLNPLYCADHDITVTRELPKSPFDLITNIHTLEHTTDPVKDLRELRDRLVDGGTLLVEVPSRYSKGGPLRLAHTMFFEPWALVKACETAGLQVKELVIQEHTQVWCSK